MAKKDVSGALGALVSGDVNPQPGNNNKPEKKPARTRKPAPEKNAMEKGIRDGWTRKTIMINKDHIAKIKIIAAMNGVQIADALDEAITNWIDSFEAVNGPVQAKK